MNKGCLFCNIPVGEIGKLDDYIGSCPNCETIKLPGAIIVEYKGTNGPVHIFTPVGVIYCEGCGTPVKDIAAYCSAEGIDVTSEFAAIKRG